MLEALDRFRIRAVLAINGAAIQAYEPVSRAALERGWEFIGHGFGQKNMQKVPDERADIAKTRDVIREFTGRAPRGWLEPGLTETCGGRTGSWRIGQGQKRRTGSWVHGCELGARAIQHAPSSSGEIHGTGFWRQSSEWAYGAGRTAFK